MTELAAWYQKKIGTYDKQEWETTIEQRIIQSSHQAPQKSAKLQPDLIDIDLVRGSSFPKAKPVQGTSTVVRLALARVLFFPFWKHWWTAHTSLLATRLFFTIWILQILNTLLYLLAPSNVNIDSSCVLVPLFLMSGLGVAHAFIVSTTHPHPVNHRCSRSLNHDRKRPCLLSHGIEDTDIFRSANNSSDINNQSIESSPVQNVLPITHNISTQTEFPINVTYHKDEKGDEDLSIPTVSLTPPNIQNVKFKLKNPVCVENKISEDNSPILRRRHNHSNSRLIQISAEDDGFESLNGNNSNGSENGEELSNFHPNKKNLIDKNRNSDEMEENIKDDSNLITFREKILKKPANKLNQMGRKCYSFRNTKESEFWHSSEPLKNNSAFENISAGSGNTVRFRCGPQVCSDGGSSTNLSGDQGHCESDEWWDSKSLKVKEKHGTRSDCRIRKPRKDRETHMTSSSEEECDTASASLGVPSQNADFAQTTNSEECSYCSEPDESESEGLEENSTWEPFTILNPASDRVSCTIWENGRIIKIPMSVVEISHAIVRRAELALNRNDGGFYTGTLIAGALAALPTIIHLLQILVETGNDQVTIWDLPGLFLSNSPFQLLCNALGETYWERIINLLSTLLRLGLGALIFFLLAVAQRAFNQRFFYAKLFSHLTSARRARQSLLPHFRLNRVRNIKTWLSVRSYLMRRGPQRSVDIIVSSAVILLVFLISFLAFDLLQDQVQGDLSRTAETFSWAVALGIYLLRLVALGTRASRKHKCLPVLLTEQINLHLAMERRPASKERLSVANNVLKLAADLLKELDSPFKISGLSANPYLYTITKVVVLSALSGVLSEILGFKLKLHKIKIK